METKLQAATGPKPVDQFLAELQAFVEEHHPKKSKMIQAIVNGTASKKALQSFAKEFYAYPAFSLRPLAAQVAHSTVEITYQLMQQHLAGEAGPLNKPPNTP